MMVESEDCMETSNSHRVVNASKTPDNHVSTGGKTSDSHVADGGKTADDHVSDTDDDSRSDTISHSSITRLDQVGSLDPVESEQEGVSRAGSYINSVTDTVNKHIGNLSRQATRERLNLGGLMRQASAQDLGGAEDADRRAGGANLGSPSTPNNASSLLHKKLYDANVQLWRTLQQLYEESFQRNATELKKVEYEISTKVRPSLQESAVHVGQAVQTCCQIREGMEKVREAAGQSSLENLK